MSETKFDELMQYARFTATDERLVRALGVLATHEFPRIAHEFHERSRAQEGACADFVSSRCESMLVQWMKRICSGPYDEVYFAETAKFGRTRARTTPQRDMCLALAFLRTELARIAEQMGANAEATREALTRVFDLELAIVLEAYQESFIRRIRRAERTEVPGHAVVNAEPQYVSAVEHVPALIVGVCIEGKIRFFNREAERISGFTRAQVMGRPFAETLVTEDLRRRVGALVVQLAAGEVPSYACETGLTLRTKAGRFCEIAWNFTHAPTEHDEVVLFAMGLDVTDARVLEERTRQAEKLAAIGNLAAGLAHEIRNPLNGAKLHVSFLERAIRKKDGDAEMLEATQVVSGEIRRMADLVSSFLEFARPRPLELRSTHLLAACTRALDAAGPSAAKAGVRLLRDLPREDVAFEADPERLDQVLMNLLHNGIDALQSSDGATVTLRADRLPRHVVFEVEDDGPGFVPPDAPIFDAFFSTKKQSAGLGLAIVHRIVTDHGGTIEVTCGPPRTIFRVCMPLSQPGAGTSS